RLFGNVEWRLEEALTVNLGAMLEDHDLTGTAFSPRFALNWHLHPRHTLRFAASRSVRVPSLFEAGADAYNTVDIGYSPSAPGYPALDGQPDAIFQEWRTQGSPDNETVDNFELGWLFDLSPELGLRGDVKLFYEQYDDLLFEYQYPMPLRDDLALCDPVQNPLVAKGIDGYIPDIADMLERDRAPDPWTKESGDACNLHTGFNNQEGLLGPVSLSFANQVALDIYGIETSLEWRPSHRMRVIGSYSLAKLRNLEMLRPALLDNDFTNRDGNWLDRVRDDLQKSVPSHVLSVLAIYRPRDDLTLSAALYHVGDVTHLEDGGSIDSWNRLDLRAAKRFEAGAWRGEVYAVVQNAGRDYPDFENKNVFDTRLFAGIRLYQ
ncbi:MAG TPA: TonB-dependent receptor, partial [Gammaproteobacteria bacterium]